jgi:hypothetical protein
MAAQMAPSAFLALVLRENRYILRIFGGVRPEWQNFLVHVGADLRRRWGYWR